MKKCKFEIIVGNTGIVGETDHEIDAEWTYDHYVSRSKEGRGNASGEPVTLIADGIPIREYHPPGMVKVGGMATVERVTTAEREIIILAVVAHERGKYMDGHQGMEMAREFVLEHARSGWKGYDAYTDEELLDEVEALLQGEETPNEYVFPIWIKHATVERMTKYCKGLAGVNCYHEATAVEAQWNEAHSE